MEAPALREQRNSPPRRGGLRSAHERCGARCGGHWRRTAAPALRVRYGLVRGRGVPVPGEGNIAVTTETIDRGARPGQQRSGTLDRVDAAVIAVVGALTLVIGGVRATRNSFWVDEAATGVFMRSSFRGMLSLLWNKHGMGPYYACLWFWTRLGHSDWWLRGFSILGGTLAAVALYYLARLFCTRAVAVIAAGLFLCHPQFLMNLTNARDYSWLMFVAVLGVVCVMKQVESPTVARAIWCGVVNGTLLALNPLTAPLLAMEWLWGMRESSGRAARRRMFGSAVLSVLLFLPFVHGLFTEEGLDWIPRLTTTTFWSNTLDFMGGAWWASVLAAGNLALVVLFVARRLPRSASSRSVLLVAGWVVTPLALAVVSTAKPLFISRYMLHALPLLVLGAAAGFGALTVAARSAQPSLRRVASVTLAAAVTAAVLSFPYTRFGTYGNIQDLRGAARVLEVDQQPGDRYLFSPGWSYWLVGYYWPAPDGSVVTTIDGLAPGTRVWIIDLDRAGRDAAEDGVVVSRHPLANAEVVELRVG